MASDKDPRTATVIFPGHVTIHYHDGTTLSVEPGDKILPVYQEEIFGEKEVEALSQTPTNVIRVVRDAVRAVVFHKKTEEPALPQ